MTYRPLATSARFRRGTFLGLGVVALAALVGCSNPNFIGLQDFGTINGNVVDQNGKPVAQAIVTATGTAQNGVSTSSNGQFNLVNVAVGEQTVTATAAGYQGNAQVTVIVVKNQNVTAGNLVLTSITGR